MLLLGLRLLALGLRAKPLVLRLLLCVVGLNPFVQHLCGVFVTLLRLALRSLAHAARYNFLRVIAEFLDILPRIVDVVILYRKQVFGVVVQFVCLNILNRLNGLSRLPNLALWLLRLFGLLLPLFSRLLNTLRLGYCLSRCLPCGWPVICLLHFRGLLLLGGFLLVRFALFQNRHHEPVQLPFAVLLVCREYAVCLVCHIFAE